MSTPITKETLIKFGMIGTNNPIVPMEKKLTEEDEDGCYMALVVSQSIGMTTVALMIPQGHMIHLSVDTIEQLEEFEKRIGTYEPNY